MVMQNGTTKRMHEVLIVCATRGDADQFHNGTLLGQSLPRLTANPAVTASVAYRNALGLPQIYNAQINEANRGKILVFVHDDVRVDEPDLQQSLDAAIQRFDLVGLAGNKRRAPGQAAWLFPYKLGERDAPENLTGTVSHIQEGRETTTYYGPSNQ